MAARLHETGHTTIDVDICPSLDDANLSNLADGLRELGARLRVEGDPAGVAFDPHPAMLRDVEMMTLITEEGPLDLCFAPAGFPNGYDSLSEHASVIVVGVVDVPVASLRDVTTSAGSISLAKTGRFSSVDIGMVLSIRASNPSILDHTIYTKFATDPTKQTSFRG